MDSNHTTETRNPFPLLATRLADMCRPQSIRGPPTGTRDTARPILPRCPHDCRRNLSSRCPRTRINLSEYRDIVRHHSSHNRRVRCMYHPNRSM